MKYKDMIQEAYDKGLTTPAMMWQSVNVMEPMLAALERDHPEMYSKFLRDQHEVLHGKHYNHIFAEEDIAGLKWKSRDGKDMRGGHWTKDEVIKAASKESFPEGTTDCDKWVAYNVWYADLCCDMDDSMLLKTAHSFFFEDEDAPAGKVWIYMKSMR